MASRKPSTGKPAGKPPVSPSKTSAPRGASGSRSSSGSRASATATAKRPVNRKPNRSIVNQKQRPWGLIATAVVIVLFAAGIVIYAVTSGGSNSTKEGMSASKNNDRYRLPEIAAAKKIPGLIYKVEPNHNHVVGTATYDTSPPIGGNHSSLWANCTGTVYSAPIANENAVHMLEHGAVWITYNPDTIKPGDLNTLKQDVQGIDRLALSPYPGLKTPISLQAWGYQLFVQRASDPRVGQFIDALKDNPATTPELGVSCSDPYFDPSKSTPGHPQDATG
jgi:hypothetical protein